MRRYGVRFLVAVLTFGIGVALSFALGLFRVPDTKVAHKWSRPSSCRKEFRTQNLTVLKVDNSEIAPLKLTFLGGESPADRSRRILQVLVENTSNRTVSRFVLTGENINRNDGSRVDTFEKISDSPLGPGRSKLEFVFTDVDSEVSLGVASVDFQDGSTWTNPRWTR